MQSDRSQVNSTQHVRRTLLGIIETWALLGGLLLVVLVLITAAGLASERLFNKPLAGQFELVEMGVAVAVFAFLPYCQITSANVTADIFTTGAGPLTKAIFALIAALIALGVSAILLWRMWNGLLDYREFPEFTAITNIPIWYAYLPILASLALLAVACVISFLDSIEAVRRGGRNADR